MKALAILVLFMAVVAAKPHYGNLLNVFDPLSGGFLGLGNGGLYPNSQFFQALLERDLQRLLATPDFPEDLAVRANEAVANAEAGFRSCDSNSYPFLYLQRICIVQTYAAARNALSDISQEAQSRPQSSTASPTSQPPVA